MIPGLNPSITSPSSPALAESERPYKKARTEVKSEHPVSDLRGEAKANPPLVPFASAARFHAACYIDLSRACIDLSPEGSAAQESIPVSLIPNANISAMSRLPIVQSPADPSKNHDRLPQPAAINRNMPLRQGPNHSATADVVLAAREQMDELLQNPSQRQRHERQHFKLAKIRAKHLSNLGYMPSAHPTLNMRGVIASIPLKAGTPLQYSGQYLDQQERNKSVQVLSGELQTKAGIPAAQADTEAERLLTCYQWEGITYKGKKYDISAFGAGNTAGMVNHDQHNPNMGVAYMSTYDQQGQPAPQIVVYFALRDIAQDEQLLVNYGEAYQFAEPLEGQIALSPSSPESFIMGRRIAAAKPEAAPTPQRPDQELATANILLDLAKAAPKSPSQHLGASPLRNALKPERQRALDDFNRELEQVFMDDSRQQDARQHAAFFFRQPALPIALKKAALSEVLLKILGRNEPGSLGKLRANWPRLDQLQPKIEPGKLLDIANNDGGCKTLEYLKSNWPQLQQLDPQISPTKLLTIANNTGGGKTLSYIKDNWTTLTRLQPAISPEQLVNIANNGGGSKTLHYLLVNWHKLNQLQPNIATPTLLSIAKNKGGSRILDYVNDNWSRMTQEQPQLSAANLLSIANNNGGSKTLDYLQENWPELTQFQPSIPIANLLAIANNNGGSRTLEYLKQHWQALNQLEPKVAPEKLLHSASNNGGSKTLEYLLQNWSLLTQLEPKIAPEKLLNIANHDGGSNALDTIKENWTQLNKLEPKIDAETILTIANNNGGGRILNYLKENWKSLNQLEPPIAPKKLLAIANNGGSSITLDYIQQYWSELTQLQPTINPEKLLDIANNGGSSRALHYIHNNWAALNQLQPKPDPAALLNIANNDGGSKTLNFLRKHWPELTAFANNNNESITVAQLGSIGSRKSATKGLEVLLKNDHIKTLPMEQLVKILSSERRTASFLKNHPNVK